MNKTLPANAEKLFWLYVADSANWSGTPLVNGNVTLLGEKEDRGLLTHLKVAGLIETFIYENAAWIRFTDAGKELAIANGYLWEGWSGFYKA